MQPGIDAVRAHRVERDEGRQPAGQQQHGWKDVEPACAGDQEHRPDDGRQQGGGPHVGLFEDEAQHDRHAKAGMENSTAELRHGALEVFAVPGNCDNHDDLGELGRLQVKAGGADPARGAFLRDAHVRDPNADQQHDSQSNERPPELFQPTVIDRRAGQTSH